MEGGSQRDEGAVPAARALVEALPASFARPAITGAYRRGIALATLIAFLLPLVYLALVASVVWGTVWYAQHGDEWVGQRESGRVRTLAYLGPLWAGVVLVFFLLKPLLARQPRSYGPFVLSRAREPVLHAYLERLAELLGVPAPERVVVDLDVNASASFTRGLRSVLGGGLTLTLGLPLVSNLSLRELSAILAHEYGHFAQGAGMRFYYATQVVNRWLLRVAYERDKWDERLAQYSRRGGYLLLLFGLARGAVWLTRALLAPLARLGSAATAFLSRQMEFDADHNAALLAGTRAFADGMRGLVRIEAAMTWAQAELQNAYKEGRLADDFPRLVRYGLEVMPAEVSHRLLEQALGAQPRMYATHPPIAQRLARAETLAAPGKIALDAPASALFAEYPLLCRDVSRHQYEGFLSQPLPRLVPTETLIAVASSRLAHERSALRYFLGLPFGAAQLDLTRADTSPPADPSAAVERLRRVRAELLELRPEAVERLASWSALEARFVHTGAQELLEAYGVGLRAAQKGELVLEPERGRRSPAIAREADALRAGAEPWTDLLRERIALAIALSGAVSSERMPGAPEFAARGRRLIAILGRLPAASRAMHALGQEYSMTRLLLALGPRADKGKHLAKLLDARCGLLADKIDALRKLLFDIEYPYEHEQDALDLARFLFGPPPPDVQRKVAAYPLAESGLEAWSVLSSRLIGELGELCTRVEEALGLEPLPEPEPVRSSAEKPS